MIEPILVEVPAGSFTMGSPESEEGRYDDEEQHLVAIPHPFLMGKYPVTQKEWREVSSLPKIDIALSPNPSRFVGDSLPVGRVSWYEAVEFCSRLSAYTGRTYHLPSEAEWEYACRAGSATPYSFGDAISEGQANFESTAPSQVGSYPSNAFGLCDMHGNVWEWCADDWRENYWEAPVDGSAWLGGGWARVVRGGSWCSVPRDCRSAYRYYEDAGFASDLVGFRVACVLPRTL